MTATSTDSATSCDAPPLDAEGLTIRFPRSGGGTLTIVDDWDLSVPSGDIVCVAGRSGSGKTSVLRAVAGLLAPAEGRVRWWGEDLDSLSRAHARRLRRTRFGYLDQGASLLADLTVLENVLVPVLPDGAAVVRAHRDRALELLEELRLADRASHRGLALSGGERQRVVLARALLAEPDALIADEPTASLDRRLADHVISLLQAQAARGCAVLTASHDTKVAAAAHRVHRLEEDPAPRAD